jgi:V8-like Glu-specific endopeptidase
VEHGLHGSSPVRSLSVVLAVLAAACIMPVEGTEGRGSAETYGGDNRRDVNNVANSADAVAWARSAVSFIPWENLEPLGADQHRIVDTLTLRERYQVCGFEPFRAQPSAAFCSGFLAGADLVATAGHCYRSADACDDYAIVFGFAWETVGDNPLIVSNEDLYACEEVVERHVTKMKRDYAVVRLDRPVTNRVPLPVERETRAQVGDELVMIGSPSGLPLKIDEGADVRTAAADSPTFITTADAYSRGSGSPLIRDGHVVGIHINGASDFVKHPSGCFYSRPCGDIGTQSGCPGSIELHADVFAADIPLLADLATAEPPPEPLPEEPPADEPPSDEPPVP